MHNFTTILIANTVIIAPVFHSLIEEYDGKRICSSINGI